MRYYLVRGGGCMAGRRACATEFASTVGLYLVEDFVRVLASADNRRTGVPPDGHLTTPCQILV